MVHIPQRTDVVGREGIKQLAKPFGICVNARGLHKESYAHLHRRTYQAHYHTAHGGVGSLALILAKGVKPYESATQSVRGKYTFLNFVYRGIYRIGVGE
jgi:hypothetical protein